MRRIWASAGSSSLLSFAAYLALVGVGGFGLGSLALSSARVAMTVADAIALEAEDAGEDALPDMPRASNALPDKWDLSQPSNASAATFPHARTAPKIVDVLSADQMAELKQSVSEHIAKDDATPWHDGEHVTYKTMCVRLCDGAYFPISFSTTQDRFAADAARCESQCSSPARLFVFRNPGGSPETMKDLSGRSYVVLPTAYQFRRGSVDGCTCRTEPWEMASRERHRLYAVEADIAAGKPVDQAELEKLRVKFAAATSTGERQPAPITNSSVANTAPDPASGPRTRSAPIDTGKNANGIDVAALSRFAEVAMPASEETAGSAAAAIGSMQQTQLAQQQAAASETPPLPVRALATFDGEPKPSIKAGRSMSKKLALRKGRHKVASAGWRRRASGVAIASENGAPERFARDRAAFMMPGRDFYPNAPVEKVVWGVGRNAHNAPRGGTAKDTFARNFY